MEDSSKVFAIGNIEQVAVADGTVDARRATGSSSAEYLRQLSMSQRSNGVFINDPKGLFILRWYREVKGDGTPPDGPRYQNRACKYYKLTSDNDGEAFRWTSNYQIISNYHDTRQQGGRSWMEVTTRAGTTLTASRRGVTSTGLQHRMSRNEARGRRTSYATRRYN